MWDDQYNYENMGSFPRYIQAERSGRTKYQSGEKARVKIETPQKKQIGNQKIDISCMLVW